MAMVGFVFFVFGKINVMFSRSLLKWGKAIICIYFVYVVVTYSAVLLVDNFLSLGLLHMGQLKEVLSI